MKQIFQSYKTGEMQLKDAPAPNVKAGSVLVRTSASLVSVGTEKQLIEFAQKNLVNKALSRPDLVRRVLAKAQAEGIMEAWRQAMGRLNTPILPGYSSSGVILDVGDGVEGFAAGDRVACSGSGYAGHTQVALVPANLCVKMPTGVGFDAGAFVALGGIALEAVRMADVSLGSTVAVIGLGLLGQLAVQLLDTAGCRVVGMDLDTGKVEMALSHGAEAAASDYASFASAIDAITSGQGADAAIILAATPSNEPLEQAAEVCRERGRVVASGLVGLEIPRKPFYDKELDFVVSRAWGPGLYDPDYTDRNAKYPLAYARWTAKRNMDAFLTQVAKQRVQVDHLISHRYPFENALDAYEMLLEGDQPYLGVLLTYDDDPDLKRTVYLREEQAAPKVERKEGIGIGLIGAGLFASGTLLPAMKEIDDIDFRGVATATGLSGRHTADENDFDYCTTDYNELLDDPEIDLVFVLTRHGSHAHFVAEALQAGKHVFVEKPLALNPEQLKVVTSQLAQCNSRLMVGFNRRFSPFSKWLKDRFGTSAEPLNVHCTVNAGKVPPEHWVHDPEQGGGRIIGEVCHFVDLIQYLSGSLPVRVFAESMGSTGYKDSDNVTVTLKMENGALGSITYLAGGDKRYPRERVEVIGGGAVGVIDNFQKATFTQGGRVQKKRNWLSVDRGHQGEIEALIEAIWQGGEAPVSLEEYINTTLTTFAIEESIRQAQPVDVETDKSS